VFNPFGAKTVSLTDSRGLPVSTRNALSLQRLETATHLLAGYSGDLLGLIDMTLASEPDFVMGHALRASILIMSTERGAEPMLQQTVEAAEAALSAANERERAHIAAARAWLERDFARATELYGRILIDWPRDLLALQTAHVLDFLHGQSSLLRDRVARVLPDWDDSAPGFGFVLGMYAFGLEETADYARAEESGHRAVELNRRDAWAVHAVAHVMEMQGRLAGGIDWLGQRVPDWAPDNLFAYHNWWHLALYHLDLGEVARVLDLYDRSIRPKPSTVAMEMVDACALLWRLELRDVHVGARWKELADAWEPTVEDGYYAFNDAHAAMAFIGDGRAVALQALLRPLERRAAGTDTNAAMTREVGLPLTRALQAFAAHDYGRTVDLLLPLRPIAHRFGGSHAQRDLISLTLIESALRGGQGRLARALAAERRALKPSSPSSWQLWGRALQGLGDAAGAEQARNAAAAVASRARRQRSTVAAAV
jgi:tetratricopeptide (TPR) repeat protein